MTREEFLDRITVDGKIPPSYSKESYITKHLKDEFASLSAQYNGDFKHKFRCVVAGFEGRCKTCGCLTNWSTTGTWKQYCEEHHPQNRTAPIECIADYQSGLSLSDVAEKHNTSKYLVTRLLKQHNVAIRTSAEQKMIDDRATEIIEDYRAGLTISELSKKYQISLARVRYCLKGEPKRSHSASMLLYRSRNPRDKSTYKGRNYLDFDAMQQHISIRRKALFVKIATDGNFAGKRATQEYLERHGYWNSVIALTRNYDVDVKTRLAILKHGDIGRCGVCGTPTKYVDGQFRKYCNEHSRTDMKGKPAHNRSATDEARIIECYTRGMSALDISRQDWCNVSNVTVMNILERNGVRIKTQSEIILSKRTQLDEDAIRQFYATSNIAATAAELGLPLYRVREIITEKHDHKTACANAHYKYVEESKEWNQLYRQGMRITEIAEQHNISSHTVYRHIRPVDRQHLFGKQRCNHPIDWTKHNLESLYVNGKSVQEIAEFYGCNDWTVYQELTKRGLRQKRNTTTEPERIVCTILDKHNIAYEQHDRQVIKPKELDIWIPEHKMAIEVNGLYWHSTDQPFKDTRHIDKFNACRESGIRLLQFTDADILNRPELIESMILSKLGLLPTKIMARKCRVVDVGIVAANNLFEQWHYQGQTTRAAKCIGLQYENRIVAILAYTEKEHEIRIERFACELFTNVVGGYSKLESRLPVKPKVTFSLGLISDGSLYAKSGYKCIDGYATTPEFYVTDGFVLHNRQKFMKHKMPRLFGNGFDPAKTEWENVIANNLRLFFGAGITKWVK